MIQLEVHMRARLETMFRLVHLASERLRMLVASHQRVDTMPHSPNWF